MFALRGHEEANMTTGMDLKVERIRERVTVKAIAERMGVTSARITHIESQARVTAEAERRFRHALEEIVATPS